MPSSPSSSRRSSARWRRRSREGWAARALGLGRRLRHDHPGRAGHRLRPAGRQPLRSAGRGLRLRRPARGRSGEPPFHAARRPGGRALDAEALSPGPTAPSRGRAPTSPSTAAGGWTRRSPPRAARRWRCRSSSTSPRPASSSRCSASPVEAPKFTTQIGSEGDIRIVPVPERAGPSTVYVTVFTFLDIVPPVDQLVLTTTVPGEPPRQQAVRRLSSGRFVADVDLPAGPLEVAVTARIRDGSRMRGGLPPECPRIAPGSGQGVADRENCHNLSPGCRRARGPARGYPGADRW